jgi:hypothetical protein
MFQVQNVNLQKFNKALKKSIQSKITYILNHHNVINRKISIISTEAITIQDFHNSAIRFAPQISELIITRHYMTTATTNQDQDDNASV